jgi:ribitol-5-phosphate 2-dehydrogenase (NADP+)
MGRVATVYRLTRPFRLEAFEEEVPAPGVGQLLLRPSRVGICGSDLKLYTGTRERSAMMSKLPIALLHEAIAEVVEAGPDAPFAPGDRVVPSPNIPCTVAHPERPIEEACYACRPGGAGENYCTDGYFLSSNTDGMARTAFLHPAACTVHVPPNASDTAVLTEPLATVLAGLEAASADRHARFLVLGNGPIGLLTATALRATLGVPQDRIIMTGRRWSERAHTVEGLATPIDEEARDLGTAAIDQMDVAFECVGGDANEQTLALMIDLLRPGGRGILFGPSETPMLFDTRKVIAKGLNLIGRNRASLRHFDQALELVARPDISELLERAVAPKEFKIGSIQELDDALYHAWTKEDAGRAVTVW